MDQLNECRKKVKSGSLRLWLICLVMQSICFAVPEETGPIKQSSSFSVKVDADGKYWFAAPSGKKFLSFGINHISIDPGPDGSGPATNHYNAVKNQFGGSFDSWKNDVMRLMAETGFNTIGAWSDPELFDTNEHYATACLYVAGRSPNRMLHGFLPDFEEQVRSNIADDIGLLEKHTNLFGVFLDNEMRWYGEDIWEMVPNYTLLERALYSELTPSTGKETRFGMFAIDFLKTKYKTTEAFSQAWGRKLESWDQLDFAFAKKCDNDSTQADREEFTALAAEMFYSKASKTVRAMLPGKLILGTRYAQRAPKGVIEACGKYCDVISFNDYRILPEVDPHLLAKYYIWGGKKPLMVSEFAWRAEQNSSGNPNTKGAGKILKTQAERAAYYIAYVEDLVSYPMIVGAHWFEFADQPPQGRSQDGEDSNYGVVDIRHRPYSALLTAMRRTNKKAEKIHAESTIQPFTDLLTPSFVTFAPALRPERLPFIDLLIEEPILQPTIYSAEDAGAWVSRKLNPLILKYDTGQSWGCGAIFFGPKKYATGKGADHTTDLEGYSRVVIDAEIPAGLKFNLLIDESGVASSYAETFNTEAGDDGESFSIRNNKGRKGRSVYTFNLKDLKPRDAWGNQRGKRCVDMNAIKGIGIYLYGEQGKGKIKFHSIKLER